MPEIRLTVNGGEHVVDAPIGTSLAQVLRERLGLTGTKIACDEGHCGACTVQVDGVPVLSCITLSHTVQGEVTTIEALRDHPLVDEEDPLEQWPEGPGEVVGRPAPRKDARERVRGEARYTADVRLPGMLHAALLRSPHPHARVASIDLAPALALPGVRAAVGPG